MRYGKNIKEWHMELSDHSYYEIYKLEEMTGNPMELDYALNPIGLWFRGELSSEYVSCHSLRECKKKIKLLLAEWIKKGKPRTKPYPTEIALRLAMSLPWMRDRFTSGLGVLF